MSSSARTIATISGPPASGESVTHSSSRYEARRVGDSIYDDVVKHTDREGRNVSEMFAVLPSRKDYPDYYILIKQPMALDMIAQKLSMTPTGPDWQPPKKRGPKKANDKDTAAGQGYNDVDEVLHDFELVWKNAKKYNTKESLVFKDAQTLHRLTKKKFAELTNTHASPSPGPDGDAGSATGASNRPNKKRRISSSGAADATQTGEIKEEEDVLGRTLRGAMKTLDEVLTTAGDGYRALEPFDELPDKKAYPDYFKVITNPLSLRMINDKIQAGSYASVGDWKNDMNVMFDNALYYNEEGSMIYQDAALLKGKVEKITAGLSTASTGAPRLKLSLNKATTPSDPKKSTKPFPKTNTGDSLPSSQPSSVPHPATKAPSLPMGAVSEDIVDRLDDFSESAQASWARTLPNNAMRKLKHLLEERQQDGSGQVARPPVLTKHGPPSVPSLRGILLSPNEFRPPPMPFKDLSLVRYVNITYKEKHEDADNLETTIKLFVSRDIHTHVLQLPSSVTKLQVTAFLEEGFHDLNPLKPEPPADGSAAAKPREGGESELSPDPPERIETELLADQLSYAPLPELSLKHKNTSIDGELTYRKEPQRYSPSGNLSENWAKRPNGSKWSIELDASQAMSTLEIRAYRPSARIPDGRGSVKDTITIYINKQI